MKRFIALGLSIILLCAAMNVFAAAGTVGSVVGADTYDKASYYNTFKELKVLGILKYCDTSLLAPGNLLTRKQFAGILTKLAGLDEYPDLLIGAPDFKDVDPKDPSGKCIKAVYKKDLITSMPDGMFHPDEPVTFAQFCTAAVKLLGYGDGDIIGLWPKNYIDKAQSLEITKGLNFRHGDELPIWTAFHIIQILFDTEIKKTASDQVSKTYAEKMGFYEEFLVLADSNILQTLDKSQVLTDKGTFYIDENMYKNIVDSMDRDADGNLYGNAAGSYVSLEVGNLYRFKLDGDKIYRVSDSLREVDNISVASTAGNQITYKKGFKTYSITLPSRANYYHNGTKQNYNDINKIIESASSIILEYNEDKSYYDNVLIFDPVYSKPEASYKFDYTSKKLGSIDFPDNPTIVKNGRVIGISEIEDYDVVYKVTDIWNEAGYILVVDKKIEGKITNILPNKLSPQKIEIDNVVYELGKDMMFSKINSTPGSFKVDDSIVALFNYEGKVVDLLYKGEENNAHYAFVLNSNSITSTDAADYGRVEYYAKMLFTGGTIATCRVKYNAAENKGRLVKFTKNDDNIYSISEVNYISTLDMKELAVDKDEGRIGDDYVTENIKIFNIETNETGKDAEVHVLNWTDMKSGNIILGKTLYINKVGDFNDINLMVVNDMFNQKYKFALIKDIQSSGTGAGAAGAGAGAGSSKTTPYNYKLLIEGKEYSYSDTLYFTKDSVVRVSMANNTVKEIMDIRSRDVLTDNIQAVDNKRIKIKDKIYRFKDTTAIYLKKADGEYIRIGTNDIDTSKKYLLISVYLDKAYQNGGRAEVIVIVERAEE
ncbi:MAG TPA: S-layer homology domain-containing protein [Clostridiales bacterium]|nr:S-layer homology domain-containing protein [Clostridiales bacterium]